jgi:hypothetical protein
VRPQHFKCIPGPYIGTCLSAYEGTNDVKVRGLASALNDIEGQVAEDGIQIRLPLMTPAVCPSQVVRDVLF